MNKLLIASLLTLFTTTSLASAADNQSWSSLKFKTKIKDVSLAVQTEVRYSEDNEEVFEEHVKPYIGYKTDLGEFGAVFSYLADDNFSKELEKRYAFQYGKTLLKNFYIDYSIRYRYEFRDFKVQPRIAHRTRLRNQVKLRSLAFYKWMPFVSSELNFYVNDTKKGPQGFSSHRSILGIGRQFKQFKLSVSYINNYKVKNDSTSTKHALGIGLGFKI